MQGRTGWRCESVHYNPASRFATRVNRRTARSTSARTRPSMPRRTSTPAVSSAQAAKARTCSAAASRFQLAPATPRATTGADAERPSPVLDASWWIPALAGPAACVARPRLGPKLRLPARLRRESSAERTGTVPDALPLQSRPWVAARSDEIEPPETLSSQTLGQPHPRAVQGSRHPLPCLRGQTTGTRAPKAGSDSVISRGLRMVLLSRFARAALLRRRSRDVQEGLRAAWRELLDPARTG